MRIFRVHTQGRRARECRVEIDDAGMIFSVAVAVDWNGGECTWRKIWRKGSGRQMSALACCAARAALDEYTDVPLPNRVGETAKQYRQRLNQTTS